ncbi:SCO family protein [Vibrionales bacterium C3R12]|uniref:SCO family protein n=1 Tax=Vibrio sp. 03-59-1 TaxID=2607607 RepID=UPI000DEAD19F|nr:SCO family protein [Vibrio sp. 03-59-1]NOH82383.1 SCO family protein [Vibrio sp. 03-59-1]RBW64715.1 SCO family protein [Vibrionales bacterium C3R12]
MSRNWSLILVVAFALGYGVKAYLDGQASIRLEQQQAAAEQQAANTVLFGKDNQEVAIFDPQDPRIRIVYFGFTRCPDVCPTSLAMLSGALNEIDPQQQSQLRPIFISLDPERDAADDSFKYAQYFHPMIEGLSAPLEITTTLAHHYGVIFRKTELEGSQLEYTLDHSSYFYFLKPDGTLIKKVPHTLSPAPIVEAINTLTQTSSEG